MSPRRSRPRPGWLPLAAALLTACGATPRADGPRLDAPRPALDAPRPFTPPTPIVIDIPRAPPVWLIARHDVPLVAVHVVVPYGAAADPPGQGGLAALTAEMMEQGAGRRGAAELGRAAERLGADLSVAAVRDASSARLVVLSENLDPAVRLLADVVGRPRFEPAEWARTRPLWIAGLAGRAFDPEQVAAVVTDAALFGPDHPYGHPVEGTVASVEGIELDDVRAFHARYWRPDRAIIVVVGDVTREALIRLLPRALIEWGAAGEPPPLPQPPAPPPSAARFVIVERPGSPQTVLVLAEPGPAAADPQQVAAGLSDIVLGGSFTSRLNLNLREAKGYTYGARSSVPFLRGAGLSRAGAAVQSAVTGPALAELRRELARMAADGITPAELRKARATARSADVATYETVAAAAARLAQLAGLGLPSGFDASAARRLEALDEAAVRRALPALPSAAASVIAVGDPASIAKALEGADLPPPARFDAEGRPIPDPPAR